MNMTLIPRSSSPTPLQFFSAADHFPPSGKPIPSSRNSLPGPSLPQAQNGSSAVSNGPNGPSSLPINNPSSASSSLPPIASSSQRNEREQHQPGGPIPYPPTMSPPSSHAQAQQNGSQQVVVTTSDNPLADLEPDQVSPSLKKEGSDWWAIFNGRVPRVLDVSLSLTLIHER